MTYFVYAYTWKSRDLRKIIVALLKSWVVNNVKKMNYVHDYQLKNSGIEKQELQLLIIWAEDEDKLSKFLLKNFPKLERICLG